MGFLTFIIVAGVIAYLIKKMMSQSKKNNISPEKQKLDNEVLSKLQSIPPSAWKCTYVGNDRRGGSVAHLRTETALTYVNSSGSTIEICENFYRYGGDKDGYFLSYDMFVDGNEAFRSLLEYENGKLKNEHGSIHKIMRNVVKSLREEYLAKQRITLQKENKAREDSEIAKKRDLLKSI